ncbi:MAG: hypothetical protein N2C14_12040, partial [Planctomycetales bacterium]
TFGFYLDRPRRGKLHLGFRWLTGPINSQVVIGSYAYQMNEKWRSTYGFTLDLGEEKEGAVTHRLRLSRVGESFLLHFGALYNNLTDNTGVSISIEPRFLPSARSTKIGGFESSPSPRRGSNDDALGGLLGQ